LKFKQKVRRRRYKKHGRKSDAKINEKNAKLEPQIRQMLIQSDIKTKPKKWSRLEGGNPPWRVEPSKYRPDRHLHLYNRLELRAR
jgi:hypothetical protein